MNERLDVEQLTRDLNTAAQGVFRASNKLHDLSRELDGQDGELGVGTLYEIAIEDELTAIYDEAEKADKRPPAEDIRTAQARKRVRVKHPDLDANYRRLTTEIKATQVWINNQRSVLSARQSVLNGLKALGA